MTRGLLEVMVVEAHGLPEGDFFDKIDPYVIVDYKGIIRKTSIARGQGKNPKWNEEVKMNAEYPGSGDNYKLIFKVMDHDTFTADDFLGQTLIYVDDLLSLGVEKGSYEMRTSKYRLECTNGRYYGEITIGVKFTSNKTTARNDDDEEVGGWKNSDYE